MPVPSHIVLYIMTVVLTISRWHHRPFSLPLFPAHLLPITLHVRLRSQHLQCPSLLPQYRSSRSFIRSCPDYRLTPPWTCALGGCLSSVRRRGDALVRSWNRNRNRSWSWNSKTSIARDLVTFFLWGVTGRAATELRAPPPQFESRLVRAADSGAEGFRSRGLAPECTDRLHSDTEEFTIWSTGGIRACFVEGVGGVSNAGVMDAGILAGYV